MAISWRITIFNFAHNVTLPMKNSTFKSFHFQKMFQVEDGWVSGLFVGWQSQLLHILNFCVRGCMIYQVYCSLCKCSLHYLIGRINRQEILSEEQKQYQQKQRTYSEDGKGLFLGLKRPSGQYLAQSVNIWTEVLSSDEKMAKEQSNVWKNLFY